MAYMTTPGSASGTPRRAAPLVDIQALEKKRKGGLKGLFVSKQSEKLGIIQDQQNYIMELQNQMNAMQSDLQSVPALKAQAASAADWQHKWNFMNFKVNLLVDMLVLRMMEAKGGAAGGGSSAAVAGGPAAVTSGDHYEMVEEDI